MTEDDRLDPADAAPATPLARRPGWRAAANPARTSDRRSAPDSPTGGPRPRATRPPAQPMPTRTAAATGRRGRLLRPARSAAARTRPAPGGAARRGGLRRPRRVGTRRSTRQGPRLLPSARVSSAPDQPGSGRRVRPPRPTGDGFDVPPGERIDPGARTPESPWWKADAAQDPWRDDQTLGLARPPGRLRRPAADRVRRGRARPRTSPTRIRTRTTRGRSPSSTAASGRSCSCWPWSRSCWPGGIGGGTGYWLTRATNDRLHDPDIKLATTATPLTRPPGSVADHRQAGQPGRRADQRARHRPSPAPDRASSSTRAATS